MRATRARLALAALAMALALTARAARAEPKPAEIAAARELAKEGIKLAGAGNCAAAVEKFTRAEALYHAPTILGRLGECQVELGKLVAGTENLRKVVLEDLGPRPAKAFVAAKERAKKVLEKAEPRLAKLTIAVKGPADGAAQVKLDGEPLAASMIGAPTPVDPGAHKVHAAAEGFLEKEAEVTVAEGKAESVELALEKAPVKVVEPAPKPVVAVAKAPPREPPSRAPVWVTLGIGVAGLAVGGGFGVAALLDKSSLDKACANKACPASSQGDIDALHRDGTISTIGWAVGGAGLATALVLFLVTGRDAEPAPVSVLAGPGSAAVAVRF